MEKNKPSLDQTIKEAEFMVDFFNFYDLNGDSVVSPSELDERYAMDKDTYWHAFCGENGVCKGIGVSDVPYLMAAPDAMQGIMLLAPAMESGWRLDAKGLAKQKGAFKEIGKIKGRLQRLPPQAAAKAINLLRDFWIEYGARTKNDSSLEFTAKIFVKELMNAAGTKESEGFIRAADDLYKNTMRLFDIVRGFREEFDIYAGDSNYYAFVADAFMKNIRTIGITDASEVFSRKAEAVRENTWKAFAAMSKFWNAYSTYAPQDEGGFFYTEALSEYLKAAFLNRPPRVFMQVAAELDKKGRELKDPKRLVEWAMALDKLQSDYLALKEKAHGGSKKVKLFKKDGEGFSLRTVGLKIPGGSKRVLVLNKGTNKIELQEVDSGYKYEKEGAYAPLVSTRPGNGVKIFYQNIYEFAPWLANLGRIHLAEAVSKAEALLNEKGMNMQIDGMEDVPITRVISKKMIMAIIYTEREPVTLSSVKTRKDFLDYASNVDIIIALKGDNAYVDDVSNVSASGIAQLMPGTYDDINAFFPKKKISEILPSSYEEVIVRMDYSIVTMYLVLERMAEIIAYHNKKKENWTSDDARNFFLNSSKRQAALAIAYNQGGSLPMKYAHSGKASLLTGYAKAVQNVLRFLIPV